MKQIQKAAKPKRKKNRIFMSTPPEITVIFTVLFLVAFGIVMVYSSSFYSTSMDEELKPYIKQMIFAIVGFIGMYIVSKIQMKVMNYMIGVGYIGTIVLLILVLTPVGKEINGSKRWLPIGPFNMQPSEIAKFIVILTLAYLLTSFKKHLTNPKVLVILMGIILLPTLLVAKEDWSSAALLMVISVGMIFVAYKDTIKMIFFGGFLVAVGAVFLGSSAYRMQRIHTFLEGPWSDPEGSGRQIIQALYAIGAGGLTGIGLGQSLQKMGYITEAHNDIIFAVICEEIGLIGGAAVIGLYLVLVYRIFQVAVSSISMEHYLVAIGVMIHIAVQAAINIGVATNLIPTTGMPLPFISYGGSSIIMLLLEIGLVLNVSRHNYLEKEAGVTYES